MTATAARTSTKMQFLFFICAIYVTVATVFASDIEAETLLPNIEADVFSPNAEAEVSSPNITSADMENNSDINFIGKHESLQLCPMFSLEPGEYELFQNGTVHIEPYSLTLNESHYILKNGTLSFCAPLIIDDENNKYDEKSYVENTSFLTTIGLVISMISLLIHLIIFAIVPDLKNLPGYNLAALCASLFCSYLLLLMGGIDAIEQNPDSCIATAFLKHFFMLSSILWMSIMSYDVFTSLLRATGSLRISNTNFTFKKFGIYCLCSFGVALLIAVASILLDILDGVPQKFRPQYKNFCWFKAKTPLTIFFGGPVIALTCLNFIFFGLSAYNLHFNKMKQEQNDQKSVLKLRFLMYFRLSVIMGTTWIVGIIAASTTIDWLWYVFVLLNTLQGFFIFIAFTCSAKVKKYFREKYFGGRRASEQTLSPTFQSYCFYANSIEKDMDKIVENGKEKTDTIMIHL